MRLLYFYLAAGLLRASVRLFRVGYWAQDRASEFLTKATRPEGR